MKSSSQILIIFGIFLLIERGQMGSVDIVMNDFSYVVHRQSYFNFFNITDQTKNNRKSLRIEAEFVKPAVNFDAQVALGSYNGRTTNPLFNVTINGCRSLDPTVKNRVFKIIAHAIHYGATQFPKKCPIPANKRFVIEQFYLHPEDFAFIQPGMRVRSNFSWVMDRTRIFTINMEFSTIKK